MKSNPKIGQRWAFDNREKKCRNHIAAYYIFQVISDSKMKLIQIISGEKLYSIGDLWETWETWYTNNTCGCYSYLPNQDAE